MTALDIMVVFVAAAVLCGCGQSNKTGPVAAGPAIATAPAPVAVKEAAPTTRPMTARHAYGFDRPDGKYTREMFLEDFGGYAPSETRGFGRIVDGAFQVILNPNQKVNNTGYSAHIPVPPRQQYTLSFRLRFPENFEAGLHGKQMGMSGGKGYDGGRGEQARANGDGWSIRLQFDSYPDKVTNTLYVYQSDMTTKYGGPCGATRFPMQRGRWYGIRLKVDMNSAIDKADGRIQVWCDDEQKVDATGIRFSRVESGRQIDRIRMEVFAGGGGAFPSRENCIEFDDIRWSD